MLTNEKILCIIIAMEHRASFLHIYFENDLKELIGDERTIKKKIDFLERYSIYVNLVMTISNCKISKNEFETWLMTDKAFNKIFSWFYNNKVDVLEFIFFCKCGLFGDDLKKTYKNINIEMIMQYARSLSDGNLGRLTKGVGGENKTADALLGREITNSDISVEEK